MCLRAFDLSVSVLVSILWEDFCCNLLAVKWQREKEEIVISQIFPNFKVKTDRYCLIFLFIFGPKNDCQLFFKKKEISTEQFDSSIVIFTSSQTFDTKSGAFSLRGSDFPTGISGSSLRLTFPSQFPRAEICLYHQPQIV